MISMRQVILEFLVAVTCVQSPDLIPRLTLAEPDELSMQEGDVIEVLAQKDEWWTGRIGR